jgi:hypothetical protein
MFWFRSTDLVSLFLVHLHLSSKLKSHEEIAKQYNLRFFLLIFCLMIEGSVSVQIMTDPDPGGLKTHGSYALGSPTLELTLSDSF